MTVKLIVLNFANSFVFLYNLGQSYLESNNVNIYLHH